MSFYILFTLAVVASLAIVNATPVPGKSSFLTNPAKAATGNFRYNAIRSAAFLAILSSQSQMTDARCGCSYECSSARGCSGGDDFNWQQWHQTACNDFESADECDNAKDEIENWVSSVMQVLLLVSFDSLLSLRWKYLATNMAELLTLLESCLTTEPWLYSVPSFPMLSKMESQSPTVLPVSSPTLITTTTTTTPKKRKTSVSLQSF
jgi:hypothetical protein